MGGLCAMAVLVRGRGLQVGGFWLSCFNDLVLYAEARLLCGGESVLSFPSVSVLLIWFGTGRLRAKWVEEELGVQVHIGIL